MATSRLNLTRDQLATFLKDHELIKQFERLFATVDVIAPDFVNEIAISAGSAQATANDALALIEALENSLTADGAVTDAKATLALQELQALKSELQLKTLEPVEQYNNSIITDYLTINEYGRGENAVGRIIWDDGEGTIEVGLKGGNVTCKIGVQEYVRAHNETLLTMTKGQIVYISGAQGNRVAVKLAQADGDANSAQTIGIVAETITAGGEGFVQVSGPIYKLDTLGTIAGDTVYLSPTIAGDWTTTKPVAPDHLVIIGFIERVHASVGSIFIKIDNGYELDELHNVKITSVQPDDLIQYDSAGPFWKNVAPSSVSIGTATNLAGGVAGSVPYQTGANATTFLSIGTAGQYAKVNAGATAPEWASPAALTEVDDTNVTLTLGGNASTALLNAASITVGWTGTLAVARGGTGASTASITSLNNITGYTATGATGTTSTNLVFSGSPTIATPTISTSATVPLVIGGAGTTSTLALRSTSGVGTTGADIIFQTGNNGATEAARIFNNGNVSIGSSSAISKLYVASSTNAGFEFYPNNSAGINLILNYDRTGSVYQNVQTRAASHQWLIGSTEAARINSAGNVGIGTSTNLSTLTVNGSFASKAPSTVNATTYTVAATDGSLRFTTTNCTVTLPAAASFPGRILYLNTITANSVTSAAANVIPLGSNTAGTAILAAAAGKFAMIQSDGANWITMMSN